MKNGIHAPNTMFMVIAGLALSCIISACGELIEPVYPNLINLLPGSPGYAGDSQVLGLENGSFLVRHEKEKIHQEKDPAGKIRLWHEEEWFALNAEGEAVVKIASRASDIPKHVTTSALNAGLDITINGAPRTEAVNVINGLTNGEKYTVYYYGELLNGQRIGRTINGTLGLDGSQAPIAFYSYNYNAVINLKNLSTNHQIQMFDQNENTGNRSGVFNDYNHYVVLVDTPLYWTEFQQTIYSQNNATILLQGYTYNIEIRMMYDRGFVSVDPIEEDGQQCFIMTGSTDFRGYITIRSK